MAISSSSSPLTRFVTARYKKDRILSLGNIIKFNNNNKTRGITTGWLCIIASSVAANKSVTHPTLDSKVEMLLDSVKWDDKGFAVAIAQNVDTGAILMQGFANREALAATISLRKGETSNNFINVHDVFLDCDRASLPTASLRTYTHIIYLGKPGPTCHTGSETCYYSSVNNFLKEAEDSSLALTTLYSLESTIFQRKAEIEANNSGKPSWTKRLLLDKMLLCSKIREEADELCRTLEENEDPSRSASEMADNVKVEEVLEVLRLRFTKSGIEEKNSRE
ncbi:hypothetical protein MKW94_020965 [Papaver nudicaule]|uniref:phosphoribosyl-AMP cyclohydrolase n=1 Tax=Papaver nudicaule TaxID=74823 RepID=A0AA41RNY4_PAPNU|nr:hypothetical protein [Papaver nudicaule]